ncbi:DNA-dependent ATPase mgs1, partial [Kickxella alabastrina]
MSTTSSLVSCPICDKLVPEWYASDHMDRECKGASISQDHATPNASKLPPPPPSSAGNKRTMFMASPSSRQKSSTPSIMFPSTKKARPSFDSNSEPSAVTNPAPLAQQRSHSDLLETANSAKRIQNTKPPLAERLRPLTLDSFVGQSELVGPGGILRILIESDRMSSCIFWGGPGLGKTTLARIIAHKTSAAFKEMSAVTQNTVDVKKAIEEAGNLNRLTNKRTIMFIDEIHRFNKAQQDIFLPYLERGQIVLIGATTENPSFKLNGALLSRCRVFRLEALSDKDIASIAVRAAQLKQQDLGLEVLGLDDAISKYISNISNGDARVAINIVDLAMNSLQAGTNLDLDC